MMTPFMVNNNPWYVNYCRPFSGEHVWLYSGGNTIVAPSPDLLCSCGAYRYDRQPTSKDIEISAITDFLEFDEQDCEAK